MRELEDSVFFQLFRPGMADHGFLGCRSTGREPQRQHGNVVFLTELLRGTRDLLCGHKRKAGEALETIKLARFGTRFRYTVREQDEALSWCQSSMHELVGLMRLDSKGQRWLGLQFSPQ